MAAAPDRPVAYEAGSMTWQEQLACWMNALPFVRWDRLSGDEGDVTAFGWIARDDGRSDFVLLSWDASGFTYSTSSAERSVDIGERLGFPAGGHRPCRRVADVLGDLVEVKVPLERAA